MPLGKILAITALLLVGILGGAYLFKEEAEPATQIVLQKSLSSLEKPIEIDLEDASIPVAPAPKTIVVPPPSASVSEPEAPKEVKSVELVELPNADRVSELFSTKKPLASLVETITYKSRVAWQKGRPAWLSDYASHFSTSRHFIARSLNGKPDYLKQDIAEGDQFNVLRGDKPIEFQLVIDTSRCKMWFYALAGESKEKILLKTYTVSLGRPDSSKTSGLLTPLGKYSLGSRIATYKPEVMGHHKGQKVEMIRVFGSRWIPFDKEIGKTTAPAKGFGIHGVPWVKNSQGKLEQDISSLGKYESDGCIRMRSEDVEEVFAIVVTKPTFVELVKDYSQSELAAK